MQNDLAIPRPFLIEVVYDIFHYIGEPILKLWPFSKLRERALKKVMTYIHYEDENSRYINQVFVDKVCKKIFKIYLHFDND